MSRWISLANELRALQFLPCMYPEPLLNRSSQPLLPIDLSDTSSTPDTPDSLNAASFDSLPRLRETSPPATPQLYDLSPPPSAPEPNDLVRSFTHHNRYVIERLIVFINLLIDDTEKTERLKLFLAMRAALIRNSSIDYTLNPRFPANIACLKVAHAIANPGEAICQILMPSITKVIGTGLLPSDIKPATENDNKFVLDDKLLSADETGVIIVSDLFSYARTNPALLFANDESAPFHFSAEDRFRMRTITGVTSQHFYDKLERIRRITQGKKPTVGCELNELITALLKSSIVGSGAEGVADMTEYRQPILKFYRLWAQLPDEIKDDIKVYRFRNATFSLNSFLLCLFAFTKDEDEEIQISETDFETVTSDKIFPCVHQIGLQLQSLLAYHPDLFDIPLPGAGASDQEILPTAAQLDDLLQHVNNAFNHRSPLMGLYDRRVVTTLPGLEILSQHCFDERFFVNDIVALSRPMTCKEELLCVFMMLPTRYWRYAVQNLNDAFYTGSLLGDTFVYVLPHLPMQHWAAFFEAFYGVRERYILCGVDLSLMLDAFSESQWAPLVTSMGRLLEYAMSKGSDVYALFATTVIDRWEKVFNLYRPRIEAVLRKPKELGVLYTEMPEEDCPRLFQLLQPIVEANIKISGYLERALASVNIVYRMLFLRQLESFLQNTPLTMDDFVKVIRLFRFGEWPAVIVSMCHSLRIMIRNRRDLDALLFKLSSGESSELIACIINMPENPIAIRLTAVGLQSLLDKFIYRQSSILLLFKNQLVGILRGELARVAQLMQSGSDNMLALRTESAVLNHLASHILPILLSSRYIMSVCPSFQQYSATFFHTLPDDVWVTYQEMRRVEQAMMNRAISLEDGCISRTEILLDFIGKTRAKKIRMTTFYGELMSHFGRDFFVHLDRCLSLLRTQAKTPIALVAAAASAATARAGRGAVA